jgi:uncharacterized protein
MSTVPPPAQPVPPPAATPPKRDFTMAWLCHLLCLLTMWLGPLILWLVKKDQDKLVAFHGKQTLIFGAVVAVLYIAGIVIPFLGWFCLLPVAVIGLLVYTIIGIVQTSQGKPFKYWFIADRFCKKEFAEAYPEAAAQQPAPPA